MYVSVVKVGKIRRETVVPKNEERSRTTPNCLLSKAKNNIDHNKQIYLLNKKKITSINVYISTYL